MNSITVVLLVAAPLSALALWGWAVAISAKNDLRIEEGKHAITLRHFKEYSRQRREEDKERLQAYKSGGACMLCGRLPRKPQPAPGGTREEGRINMEQRMLTVGSPEAAESRRFVECYGTKRLRAVPMTRGEYNAFRGWSAPEGEEQSVPGYLVEYLDGGKPNLAGFAGYVSWSPAEQFEKAYQPLTALSFGHAIAAMKEGHKVARAGWNGKGMFIAISPGAPQLPADRFWNPHNAEFARQNGGTADVLPCITMKTATGEILMGWLASQTDMLADDWMVIG